MNHCVSEGFADVMKENRKTGLNNNSFNASYFRESEFGKSENQV